MAEPHEHRDRPDRRVLPAGRADQGAAGRGSRAAAGPSEAIEEFFDELREKAGVRMSEAARRPLAARAPGQADAPDAADGVSPFTGAPDPDFEVLSAPRGRARRRPDAVAFGCRVSDGSGRDLFTIALTAVISIEPAKRAYDGPSRERLVELFGEPERWASTTASFRWAQADALVPGFSELDRVRDRRSRAPTTSSSARPSTSTGSPTGSRRCASTSTARVFYRGRRRAAADRPDPVGPARPLRAAGRGLAAR